MALQDRDASRRGGGDLAQDRLVGDVADIGQAQQLALEILRQQCGRLGGEGIAFGDHAARDRVLRVQEHVGHFARFDDAAGFDHGDAVADAADYLHLVRDQDDGQAQLAVDVEQQAQDRLRGFRVERRSRLVT